MSTEVITAASTFYSKIRHPVDICFLLSKMSFPDPVLNILLIEKGSINENWSNHSHIYFVSKIRHPTDICFLPSKMSFSWSSAQYLTHWEGLNKEIHFIKEES
jgi:hypothetical protein